MSSVADTFPVSERGARILADLMPEMQDDPFTRQVIDVAARELDRLEARGRDLVQKSYPHNADDTYRTLGLYERLLGLPVEPADVDLDTRRNVLLAHIRKRQDGSGEQWAHLISTAIGNTPWSHQEGPGPYQITLRIPYTPGSYTAGQVAFLARAITPAHLDTVGGFNEGFLIGISEIGVDAL